VEIAEVEISHFLFFLRGMGSAGMSFSTKEG
jgi:hypothetical protein